MEKKNVMLLAGAGQIGMAIARRMGYGMKIIVGDIKMLVNAAGVSPSQASVETILRVDLYGTAVLLEEVGKVISEGGAGVTISSQSGFRMPALTAKEDELLACTPRKRFWNFPYYSRILSGIHSTPISWQSAVMKKG